MSLSGLAALQAGEKTYFDAEQTKLIQAEYRDEAAADQIDKPLMPQ